MTELRILLLFYALLIIFISGGLFFKKSGWTYTLLAVYGVFFGLEILNFLYGTSRLLFSHPQFAGYYYWSAGFLYGPVLWFHFRFLLKPGSKFRWHDFVHLLPCVLVMVTIVDIWLLPGPERIAYISEHFLDRIMPYNYLRSWHILGYGLAILYMVYRHFSSLEGKKRIYAIAVCTIYFVTAVLLSWLVGYASGYRQFIIYYLLASTMVFIIGFILYRDPEFLNQIARKYLNSSLPKKEMERIAAKISRGLKDEKLFLRKDLTLRRLSEAIGEKPHKISQTISELMNESFSDIINKARVEHAKHMLLDDSYGHYKIEAIGLESGFNNKVTFHKAFQKFESTTPANYRTKHT
jgi:AraC-like DNA-binding protein